MLKNGGIWEILRLIVLPLEKNANICRERINFSSGWMEIYLFSELKDGKP